MASLVRSALSADDLGSPPRKFRTTVVLAAFGERSVQETDDVVGGAAWALVGRAVIVTATSVALARRDRREIVCMR